MRKKSTAHEQTKTKQGPLVKRGGHGPSDVAEGLQRARGNQAVLRLLRLGGLQPSFRAGDATHTAQRQTEEGESVLPDILNFGIGTVDNKTTRTFHGNASQGRSGASRPVLIGPGEWGDDKPLSGPGGEELNDIDFVFPTRETPINGRTYGAFKIGSNDAAITPDTDDPVNSKIDDYTGFWFPGAAKGLAGYPAQPECRPASGVPPTDCSVYGDNLWWLPLAYVQNASCACSETPDEPKANCVRKFLQERMVATPPRVKAMAAAEKVNELANPAAYAAFVQAVLTPRIYRDHVDAYASCCCPSGPAPYPAWIGVTTVPLPCAAVGASIRQFGSCNGTPGKW